MAEVVVDGIRLVVQTCCNCGVLFGLPADLDRRLRETKRSFHCPNGHQQSYVKSRAQELEEELAASRRRALEAEAKVVSERESADRYRRRLDARIEELRNSNRAYRGANTRLKNRIAGTPEVLGA